MLRLHAAISVAFLALATASIAEAKSVSVRAHSRSNGAYVPAHQRTAPNNTPNDNWSTVGNRNPITGVAGRRPREAEKESIAEAAYTSLPTTSGSLVSLPVRSGACDGPRIGGVGSPENGFCIVN